MTFGCQIHNRGPMATPDNLRTVATRAEELGFDHLWVIDRLVVPTHVESQYPYGPPRTIPLQYGHPYCEALSTLCYLAACTQRIKLGTAVLLLPLRDPLITARIITTLDYLSGGRAILGAGVGWLEEEFNVLGLDTFHERGKVADEHIRIFKELWTQDAPEFQGSYYKFSGIEFYPKPIHKPHPPIWVGGNTPAALRRAALLGDGWMPIGQRPPSDLEPDKMANLVDRLREISEKAGRPRDAVDIVFTCGLAFDPPPGGTRQMMTGRPEEIGADIVQYQQVGVDHFIFSFEGNELGQMMENMERFAKQVKPQVE